MTDALNIWARVDENPDMLCIHQKLHDKRPPLQALLSVMPEYRNTKRENKADPKSDRCSYLISSNDHSLGTYKIMLTSGRTIFSEDVTFGYRRIVFVEEYTTWGAGASEFLHRRRRGEVLCVHHYHRRTLVIVLKCVSRSGYRRRSRSRRWRGHRR